MIYSTEILNLELDIHVYVMAKQWLTWQKKEDNNDTRKTHIIIPRDICRVLAKE